MIEATAGSVKAFAGGALLYEIGYTGSVLFMQVFIADMTSLRNRLLGSFIPSAPDIITVWVSGNLVDAVLSSSSWTWGISTHQIFPVFKSASDDIVAQACGPSSSQFALALCSSRFGLQSAKQETKVSSSPCRHLGRR